MQYYIMLQDQEARMYELFLCLVVICTRLYHSSSNLEQILTSKM